MTDKLVRRFDAPTAQRIAASTELAIGGALPMCSEILPTIRKCFGCFLLLRLHASQPSKDRSHLAHIQTWHSRFDPPPGPYPCSIFGFGNPMEIFPTMVIVEHLTGSP